jgi:hypothetical protein
MRYCFKAAGQLTCTATVVSMAVGARKTTRKRRPSLAPMRLFRRRSASIFTLKSGLGVPAEWDYCADRAPLLQCAM